MKRKTSSILFSIILLLLLCPRSEGQIMISWINLDGVSFESNGILHNAHADSSYTYGAESQNILKDNEDGWVSYQVSQTGKTRLFGLKKLPYDVSFSASSLGYGFKINYRNQLYRVKKGYSDLLIDTVAAGDFIKVGRAGDTIYYYVNGVQRDKLYYNNDTNMTAVTILYSAGAKLEYAQCSFIPNIVDTIDITVDARVKSDVPTTPGGGDTYNSSAYLNARLYPKQRSYILLPIDSIPANREVIYARLIMYLVSGSGTNASYLRKVTSTWTESTVTWNTQPTSTTTGQISIATNTTAGFKTFDVTAFVKSWYANPTTNYGLLLIKQSEALSFYGAMNFASSDYTTVSQRPRLEVIFREDIPTIVAEETCSGSYYLAPDFKVSVYFEDQYTYGNESQVIYTLYDNRGVIIAGVDKDENLLAGNSPVVFVNNETNTLFFDFSATAYGDSSYFLLELIDHGGFKKQIMIKK